MNEEEKFESKSELQKRWDVYINGVYAASEHYPAEAETDYVLDDIRYEYGYRAVAICGGLMR